MSDIYISQDGTSTVDLQAYTAAHDRRIAKLKKENERLKNMLAELADDLDSLGALTETQHTAIDKAMKNDG